MQTRPKTKQITYRLPLDTIARIKSMAALHRCSEANVIDRLVHGIHPSAASPAVSNSGFGLAAITVNGTPTDGNITIDTSAPPEPPPKKQDPGSRAESILRSGLVQRATSIRQPILRPSGKL